MFNAGDEFYYYGRNKDMHGSLGRVIGIYTDHPREYSCKVNGIRGMLYLDHKRMKEIHRGEPDWEV